MSLKVVSLLGSWLILVALGVFAIMLADRDDAPGLGLMGLLLILGATGFVGRGIWRATR